MSTAYDRAELIRLADDMTRTEFDHVWTVDADLNVVDVPGNLYAPDVSLEFGSDVSIDGASEWDALTGMTGQFSYTGAVMHPSETFGRGMAERIAEMCDDAREDGKTLAWACVEVRDDDGDFPEGDPIGWAVVYRTV